MIFIRAISAGLAIWYLWTRLHAGGRGRQRPGTRERERIQTNLEWVGGKEDVGFGLQASITHDLFVVPIVSLRSFHFRGIGFAGWTDKGSGPQSGKSLHGLVRGHAMFDPILVV